MCRAAPTFNLPSGSRRLEQDFQRAFFCCVPKYLIGFDNLVQIKAVGDQG
jgi:hypothetical protein